MGLYNAIFINYYIYYTLNYGSKRIESSNFVSIIQVFQLCIVSAPFNYFGLLNGGKPGTIATIIIISVGAFNFFFYSDTRLNSLLATYNNLSDAKRVQSQYLSTAISIISLLGFFGIIGYYIYIRKH
jgi:hypothetical protein